MARSSQELLDQINEAIYQISGGYAERWTVNGETVTTLDLDKLRRQRAELRGEINDDNTDGVSGRGVMRLGFQ